MTGCIRSHYSKTFLILGALFLAVGISLTVAPRFPWLGRLPGDLLVKRTHFTFYAPIATSIILSIILTILINILKK
jgi:hypothetical protein